MIKIITMLLGGLLTITGSLVGRVLIAIGANFVIYKDVDLLFTSFLTRIKGDMQGLPADVLAFLAWCWVDHAISMIFSAVAVSITMKVAGGGGGGLTKMVFGKGKS